MGADRNYQLLMDVNSSWWAEVEEGRLSLD